MRVAEITCLTRMVRIPDLDLDLVKGDVAEVPEEKADASQGLALMRRLNAVRVEVKWAGRLRAARPAPAAPRRPRQPAVVRPPVRPPVSSEKADKPSQVELASPNVDLNLLADKLAARLGERLAALQPQTVMVPFTQTAEGKPISGTFPPEPEPMFIPAVISDPNAKADIRTETTTSEGSGVEDAAAALRKARRDQKTKETK